VTWKKANNFYQHEEYSTAIDCGFCGDLGIIRILHHEKTGFDELIKCACKNPIAGNFKSPVWDNSLSAAFKKEKCPLDWFKPTESVNVATFMSDKTIVQILEKWNARKTKSENYWENQGFEKIS
jgi:hypothetical protein